jgi:hypothetical protein
MLNHRILCMQCEAVRQKYGLRMLCMGSRLRGNDDGTTGFCVGGVNVTIVVLGTAENDEC